MNGTLHEDKDTGMGKGWQEIEADEAWCKGNQLFETGAEQDAFYEAFVEPKKP